MYGKGFRQYRGLQDIVYLEPSISSNDAPIRDKFEDVFDLIFSVDPATGFPTSVLGCYLNEHTSDEIRNFIETKLLHDNDSINALPLSVVDEFDKLDGSFISSMTPNRFESIEEYESRLSSYLSDLQESENFQKNLKVLKDKLNIKD